MLDLTPLTRAIEAGDRESAARLTSDAIVQGIDPASVLKAMVEAMDAVGGRFQANEIYVPEMLISARAMKAAMGVLEPVLVASGLSPEHTVVIGTIHGDLHDIGKNLVALMWKGAGFAVIDLGVDVAPESFAEAVRAHRPELVGISALLTTTMAGMAPALNAIRAVSDSVRVMVGGAPVTPEFAVQIGADGYAQDAGAAVVVARRLIASQSSPRAHQDR